MPILSLASVKILTLLSILKHAINQCFMEENKGMCTSLSDIHEPKCSSSFYHRVSVRGVTITGDQWGLNLFPPIDALLISMGCTSASQL